MKVDAVLLLNELADDIKMEIALNMGSDQAVFIEQCHAVNDVAQKVAGCISDTTTKILPK
ncbi:MAG: hypothetical protein R2788_04670 [Saprospiraceae bacterium]